MFNPVNKTQMGDKPLLNPDGRGGSGAQVQDETSDKQVVVPDTSILMTAVTQNLPQADWAIIERAIHFAASADRKSVV